MPAARESLSERVAEYWKALRTPWTYALHRNPYAISGFLWGLPIPVFSVVLAQWAARDPVTFGGCCARLLSHPVYLVLAAHPLLFAVLFGAFGTIRESQSRRIQKLIRRLEDKAHTDGLTGLVNQRTFQETLPLWVQEAARDGQPIALVMIDLDGLKPINDTHGHAQGDLVLRQIGRLIGAQARTTDLAARTGGDEFALVLPRTTGPQAVAIAERLRKEVAAADCESVDGTTRLPVTVSIGVAVASAADKSSKELLKASDRALYRAKAEGRNRVVSA